MKFQNKIWFSTVNVSTGTGSTGTQIQQEFLPDSHRDQKGRAKEKMENGSKARL